MTSEPPSTSSIGTSSSSDTPPRGTSDAPFPASNMDGDSIPVNESLGQRGVRVVGGRNADTLPSEVIEPVPEASADLSQRLNALELTDAPNSIDNIDPDDQQTEAQKGTEEKSATQSRDDDIGNFITSVSKEPIYTTRRIHGHSRGGGEDCSEENQRRGDTD
ncbi:hypothetical protein FS837_008755 [Tulasnella sp. UAMH 9824]|nr:hypothetical protein FS837_008755 [Tulasnella sp. UAMH 9824]